MHYYRPHRSLPLSPASPTVRFVMPRTTTKPPAFRIRLGKRIAELRHQRGLAQAHLADAVGTATETVSRIERAASIPSLDMLCRLASALGVEVEDLFSSKAPSRRPALDPDVAKLVAMVRSKPTAVRRRVLRLVKMFLAGRHPSR